jgi:hypothetical protein
MCRSTLRISTAMEELRDISVQQTARMYCSLRALVEREVLTVGPGYTFSNIRFKTRLSASTILGLVKATQRTMSTEPLISFSPKFTAILVSRRPVGRELQDRPEFRSLLRFCYDAGMYDILGIFVHLIVTLPPFKARWSSCRRRRVPRTKFLRSTGVGGVDVDMRIA